MLRVALILLLASCTFSRPVLAGGGPENLALVVNADSPSSLAVANEYVQLRGLPASHVIYLSHVDGFETTGVEQFRDQILRPVLETLQQRKLAAQIDYLVYSSDFPYAVDVKADIGDRKVPRVLTRTASLTGLTYLYPLTLAKNPSYLSLNTNRYYRRVQSPRDATPLDEKGRRQLADAVKLLQEEKLKEAAAILDPLAEAHPTTPLLLYNLACCKARQGQPDAAMALLQRTYQAGWLGWQQMRGDEDLKSLRDREDFQKLREQMQKHTLRTEPARSFRGSAGWDEAGNLVPSDEGLRYLISTMLSATSGRGLSINESIHNLQRSAAADGSRPRGTVYILRNSNVRSTTRQWAFKAVVAQLGELGVKAEIQEGLLPKGAADVAGAVIGTAGFQWESSGSTILPGAICEHLTSYGGVLRQAAGQTPLTEFLRHGAAGSSGTVTEPYAIGAKFPSPFIQVYYASGCCLGEAFYQSVAGPYQLLIVGDPLSQPWAVPPKVGVRGLEANAQVRGELVLQPLATQGEVQRFEVFLNGLRIGGCRPEEDFRFDTTEIPDGRHELRIVGIGAEPIETQGRVVVPFQVANGQHSVTLAGDPTTRLDKNLTCRAKAPGAASIAILHNGRVLEQVDASEAEVLIPAARLGMGVVHLQAVATFTGEPQTRVLSKPVEVRVTEPLPIAGLSTTPADEMQPSLQVTTDRGTAPMLSTRASNWLTTAGVEPGETFTVRGYFDVAKPDLYMLQAQRDGRLALDVTINGQPIALPDTRPWRYVLLNLAAGTHELQIAARPIQSERKSAPRLDVRFGLQGTQSLSSTIFRASGEETVPVPAP